MNETSTGLNQADQDILTDDVPDEALEAAAGTERGPTTQLGPWLTNAPACC